MYDFIIVGGGSAGCALANRLSADAGNRVLVLEAGRRDYKWDVFIHMPAALAFPIGNRLYDWRYQSDPEPHMGGRRVYHARGKVLGGSSSINGMIFQRGNPADYDKWAAEPGMENWDYRHCLPYFKRSETCLAGEDRWRGGDGPLVLERGPADSPLFTAFFGAVQEAGYELTDDVNGYRQEGVRGVRPQHPPGEAGLGLGGLPAPGDAPKEPRGEDRRPHQPGTFQGHACGRGGVPAAGTRPHHPGAGTCCCVPGRSDPPSCSSSPGWVRPLSWIRWASRW